MKRPELKSAQQCYLAEYAGRMDKYADHLEQQLAAKEEQIKQLENEVEDLKQDIIAMCEQLED